MRGHIQAGEALMQFYYNRWLDDNSVFVTLWVVLLSVTAWIAGAPKDIQFIFVVVQLVNLLNLTFAGLERHRRNKR